MIDRSEVTLYTGGHKGTEAEFGRNAERWGIRQVTFSFEGHQMEYAKDVRVLNEEDLRKGDVSMEIVSKRMGRTYAKAEKIRRVIQSLFHIVNSGYQVLAVGWIQPDDTVKGGTGWGVELAKLFNRPLSVYDQDRRQWFIWQNNRWIPDNPVVSHKTFAATGTRYLTEEGVAAVRDLFERSFGKP
jgi:hypothetical protein